MTFERSSMFIQEAIADLYQQAELKMPTTQHCIAPMSELISNFDLVCVEVPGLTQASAMKYLGDQGAVGDLPESLSVEPLAGFLYINSRYGCIFLEQNDVLVRRRFSVAHELGHYVLHFQPLINQYRNDKNYIDFELTESFRLSESDEADDVHDMFTGGSLVAPQQKVTQFLPPFEQMEREANEFAASILMPDTVVRGLCARSVAFLHDQELIWRLSTDLLVSRASILLRLKQLSLLPSLRKS